MPDFRLQPSFPIASVVDAAGRNAQLQEQAREAGNRSLIEGLQSIGQIGQSLYDTKKRVAQSLAIGKQFEVPDELSRVMDPDQVLKIGAVKQGQGSMVQYMLTLHPELANNPQFIAAISGKNTSPTASSAPTTQPAPAVQPGASLPSTPTNVPLSMSPKPEAILASNSPMIPMPAHTETPPAMPFGGASTAPVQSPVTVPIPAPPVTPNPFSGILEKPLSKGTISMIKLGMANQPQKVLTREDALNAGSVPKGTHILPDEKGDTSATGTAAYLKNQEKLEQQYTNLKAKALSNRSGGLGLEDGKVGQAIHLRKSINQQYDTKTGQYNIPPSLHSEYVLGLARLMSPNGQVAAETMNQLRQRTAREGAANVLISMGFDPEEVGGTTQSVAKFFVKQIDRQGQTAEENRQGYMDYIHGQAPVDLEPARIAAHDKKGLNSFSDLLAKSPDYKANAPTGLEFTNPDKEKRYQEFKARQK